MSGNGAEAYRKRLERAARLKAAGTPEQAGYKLPEGQGAADDGLREKRRKVSEAARADYLIRDAMNRGEFDNLQYAGQPIPGLDDPDPDWWLKGLIKREQLTGLGPPALQLRVEDAEFETRLDRLPSERQVREAVEDFNARVVEARRQLLGGPPVVTRTRDAGDEVLRWRQRRGLPAPEEKPVKDPADKPDETPAQQPGAKQERTGPAEPEPQQPAEPAGWTRRLRGWLQRRR